MVINHSAVAGPAGAGMLRKTDDANLSKKSQFISSQDPASRPEIC